MPRKKVLPEERKRADKACVPCRISKKRCDSRTPCSNCRRRNREAVCVYNASIDLSRARDTCAVRNAGPDSVEPMRSSFDSAQEAHNLLHYGRIATPARAAPYTPDSTVHLTSDAAIEDASLPAASVTPREEPTKLMPEVGGDHGKARHQGRSVSANLLQQWTWETQVRCLFCGFCGQHFANILGHHRLRTTDAPM